ncbi:MAG: cyclic nucleotide-binding domain-containing protein [Desulfobacteraceae bacterium]|jgi:CRP-like cAMP-binding protein
MSENQKPENDLSIVHLKYKKGDLVIKEGDYGLSIYKIIEGKISIYTGDNDTKVLLATLGPGAVIGEMTFLDERIEHRIASARAAEDTLLELWHPRLLKMEYAKMPPIIRFLADQTLRRLVRINKLVVKLTDLKKKKSKEEKAGEPWESKRRYYRKKVSLPFKCSPLYSGIKGKLSGTVKNISLGGAGLEVIPLNSPIFPYRVGEEFILNVTLPKNKNVEVTCKLASIREGKLTSSLFLGVSFVEMSEHSSKNLGFFMMP